MISKTYGKGKYVVNINVHNTAGVGLAVFIRGGERPLLGGVALATPEVQMDGQNLLVCDFWNLTVPGHKDGKLAKKIANKLCMATGEPVSVSLGVQVDPATEEEIKILWEKVESSVDLFLNSYLRNG